MPSGLDVAYPEITRSAECSQFNYSKSMRDPIFIGNRTEGKVFAALADAGYQVLLPFGSGCRYDLAFDDHRLIKRVQCKTGQLFKNRVRYSSGRRNSIQTAGLSPTQATPITSASTVRRRQRFTSCP